MISTMLAVLQACGGVDGLTPFAPDSFRKGNPEQEVLILVFANRADWYRYTLLLELEGIILRNKN